MSGMFYTIKETAEKLKIAAEEVQKLIEQDKLREFRIGSDLLLKAEEVEALAAEKGISAEPEVPAGEQASIPIAPETPEPEAGEVELGEFELPESEAVVPESPALDVADLESLSVGEEVPAYKASEVKAEDITAVQPKAASKKKRSKAKQQVARTRRRRLSIGQWFWRGLLADSPGAVILLCLLLGGIIIGCLALGTVLYEML